MAGRKARPGELSESASLEELESELGEARRLMYKLPVTTDWGHITKALDRARGIVELLRGQVARGLHTNPPLVIYANPPRGGELMSRRVYAVEYKHADDGEDYRHDCSRGVAMFAVPGGGILLQRPDRKPLSKDFEV